MNHESAGVRAGEMDGWADDAVIDLHLTDAACAAGAGQAATGGVAALSRAGVVDGLPFLLGADGSYDLQLNRFFRDLDGWGVRAANSVLAYARDIMLFCRFLAQSRGGKSIWECDTADLRAYKRARLHTPGPAQVSVATWRRLVAALDKWAAWSVYEGLIGDLPFRYVDRTVFTPQGMRQVRINAESEPHPGPPPVKFVSFEDYLLWRDVRLAGVFGDKSQLIVYNHMWFPGEQWQCPGCTGFTSQFTRLEFLDSYDARFVIVTQGPIDEALAYKRRVGNKMTWYSTANSPFGRDVGAPPGGGFAVNVFLRDGDTVYRTWHTSGRGTEQLGYAFALIDVLPYGRQEEWQDSPGGWPQSPTYSRWAGSEGIAAVYGPAE